jgi:predicted O-methyltransferase YrrM|tara:strand:+ start:46475 stop:47074 length:600 start_codon:yes stop_codon:yes gene_type:complete
MIDNFKKIKGFLKHTEGVALYENTKEVCVHGNAAEIGSYCGKSTCYIAQACKENNSLLYAIDHHRGSEEQQKGQEYFDEEIFDVLENRINTYPLFLKNIKEYELDNFIKPMVMDSISASKEISEALDFIFIDGSHTYESARNDYKYWKPKLRNGGILAIHDIYDSEDDGGQAPREIYETALREGFTLKKRVESLVLLVR